MVQSTLVTVASVPVYYYFQKWFGIVGLAWASNVAIFLQMISLAVLLKWKGMLELDRGRWFEIGRAVIACLAAWAGAWVVIGHIEMAHYRWPASAPAEIGIALVAFLVWLAIVAVLSHVLRLHQLKSEVAQGWGKLQRRFG
jgi:peptidoglycan biosynthesis protein MviN/MurJ (putative lipid II flippase)